MSNQYRQTIHLPIPYHDNSRGAKTTLTPHTLCYSLLCRMRVFDISYTLYCDDVLAVDTNERRQAGIDGCVVDFLGSWVHLRHDLQAIRIWSYSRVGRLTTVQAPQPPSAQPSLVPVNPIPLRYSSRVISGSIESSRTLLPLT